MKSEPMTYSIEDLARDGRTVWDGVRNYLARNYLRDSVKDGDGVLFYHSSAKPRAVVGTARVVRAGFPDPTQFERESPYFDPGSSLRAPRWFAVELAFDSKFARPVTPEQMRETPALADMLLLRKAARLSIQPVSEEQWRAIIALGRE